MRYASAEDARGLGSAYWVWKQACGDPQNGVQETGDGLIPQDCATGEWLEPRHDLLSILSRPYPRVVPGTLQGIVSHQGSLEVTGRTGEGESCDLEIWFPGEDQPLAEVANLEDITFTQVPGGWLVGGCVKGDYALHVGL